MALNELHCKRVTNNSRLASEKCRSCWKEEENGQGSGSNGRSVALARGLTLAAWATVRAVCFLSFPKSSHSAIGRWVYGCIGS